MNEKKLPSIYEAFQNRELLTEGTPMRRLIDAIDDNLRSDDPEVKHKAITIVYQTEKTYYDNNFKNTKLDTTKKTPVYGKLTLKLNEEHDE